MFKKILENIKKHKEEQVEQKRIERTKKYYEIRGAVIKFFEDKETADGTAEIPAFMQADELLKQVITSPADIDFYYTRLRKYKAVA